jgi:hypothetical protein
MPKFVVTKRHDALVYYEAIVEAATPADARDLARSYSFDCQWFATGDVSTYDDFEIDADDGVRPLENGETIEAFLTLAVTVGDRDTVLAGLRLLQTALARGDIDPSLTSILTNDDAHAALDLTQIDALCERINV